MSGRDLATVLAECLDEALLQLWIATHDPESFNPETANKAAREIRAKASAAIQSEPAGPPAA